MAVLEASWRPFWAVLEASWAVLEASWSHLDHLGSFLMAEKKRKNTKRERTSKFYEIGTAPRRENSFRGSGGCILKPLKQSSSHLGALVGAILGHLESWKSFLGILGGSWGGPGVAGGRSGTIENDRKRSKTIENDRAGRWGVPGEGFREG